MRLPLNSSGIIFSLEQSHITATVVLVNTNLTHRLHSRYQSTVEFQLSAKGVRRHDSQDDSSKVSQLLLTSCLVVSLGLLYGSLEAW